MAHDTHVTATYRWIEIQMRILRNSEVWLAHTRPRDMTRVVLTTRKSTHTLQAISYSGDGLTPANAGVELDAVVDMTEDAANRILDAAGRITNSINKDDDWNDENVRQKAFAAIQNEVDEIFMACSFQDITSQRIRKTLDNLHIIEDRLSGVLDKLGIKPVDITENRQLKGEVAASQDDIDALFASERSK